MAPTPTTLKIIRIFFDYFAILFAFIAAYLTRQFTDLIPTVTLPISLELFPPFQEYFTESAILALTIQLILAFKHHYSLKTDLRLDQEILDIFFSTTLWIIIVITTYFFLNTTPFSRLTIIFTWLFANITLIILRLFLEFLKHQLIRQGKFKKPTLILGNNKISESLIKSLQHQKYFEIHQAPLDLNQIKTTIKTHQIEEIFLTTHTQLSQSIINLCRELHIIFNYAPDLFEIQNRNLEINLIDETPILKLKPTPLEGWSKILKRLTDLIGATAAIIIFSPIMLISAILIKIDDPKSTIIYKHLDNGDRVKRVGLKGKLFPIYKFRTMKPGTHQMRYNELSSQNTRQEGDKTILVKIKNDPRVTNIGKFLRKFSLDELPQFFNVLKGEMSLVGPRPHLPEEVEKYEQQHKFLLTIKPGVTGLSATSGRSDLKFDQEFKLETYYIENWNLLLDLKIIFKTIFIIFKKYQE